MFGSSQALRAETLLRLFAPNPHEIKRAAGNKLQVLADEVADPVTELLWVDSLKWRGKDSGGEFAPRWVPEVRRFTWAHCLQVAEETSWVVDKG